METEKAIARYRRHYGALLRLYPKPYRDRFEEPMEQSFADLLHENTQEGRALFSSVLGVFLETSAAIFREQINHNFAKHRNLISIAVVTVLFLSIPIIAMQFTSEVKWTVFDFVFAGALLFGTGLLFEFVRKRTPGNRIYLLGTALALAAVFLLVWISGAVGIIGSERNPLNLLYLGVIGIALIGAVIVRLQPRGVSRALFAAASAQALVPVIALIVDPRVLIAEPPGVLGVFALNACFVFLFGGAGWLFRCASRTPPNRDLRSARKGESGLSGLR